MYIKPLEALAQVRHDFAHGKLDALPLDRAKAVADEFLRCNTRRRRGRQRVGRRGGLEEVAPGDNHAGKKTLGPPLDDWSIA